MFKSPKRHHFHALRGENDGNPSLMRDLGSMLVPKDLRGWRGLMQAGRGFRKKRFAAVKTLIADILSKKPQASILDIGGEPEYWDALPGDMAARCDLVILNVEARPLKEAGRSRWKSLESIAGDGCDLSIFADAAFDLAHSNSVIEHVGSVLRMRRFATEQARVGDAVYVQTPYLWFPVEPHYGSLFVHWLPAMHRARIERDRGLGVTRRADRSRIDYFDAHEIVNRCILLDRTCFRELFPGMQERHEEIGPIVKSLVATRAHSGRTR